MIKLIGRVCYWLGMLWAVLALVTRIGTALGLSAQFQVRGSTFGYHIFLDGALLFFFATMATASYTYVMSHKP
jgi:hypothetical protein